MNRHRIKFLYFFGLAILLFFSEITFAQDTIIHDARSVRFLTYEDIRRGNFNQLQIIDTTLSDFHIYDPLHKLKYDHFHLGNIGTAHHSLVFDPDEHSGFQLGYDQFYHYLYNAEDISYFNTFTPFTSLYYVMGFNNEQLFKVSHTQNIKPNINLGGKYRRIVSDGYYDRQRTDIHNLMTWGHYNTPNRRYDLFVHFILNDLDNQENGGLISSLTDQQIFQESRKKTLDVKLNNAASSWKENEVQITQSWNGGDFYTKKIDDTTEIKVLQPSYHIIHNATFKRQFFIFQDNGTLNGTFYPDIFFDSSRTYDSTSFLNFSNELSFVTDGIKKRTEDSLIYRDYLLGAGIEHSFNQISQHTRESSNSFRSIDSSFHNIMIKINFHTNPSIKKALNYNFSGAYFLTGYNQQDYKLKAEADYLFSDKYGKVSAKFFVQRKKPSFTDNRYLSNHFIYDHLFKPLSKYSAEVKYTIPGWDLSIGSRVFQINNYIYFDTTASPVQLSKGLQALRLTLEKQFNWKAIHFYNLLVYQQFSADIIRNPDLWSRHVFFAETHLFNDAMLARTGVEVFLKTPYFADAYMPVNGRFFIQDEKKYAYYPVLNIFFSSQIKKARVFVKAENINELFNDRTYFDALNYPGPEFSIKLGISWMFYD